MDRVPHQERACSKWMEPSRLFCKVCRSPQVNRLSRNGCRWDVDARTRNWRDAAGGIHGRGSTRTEQLELGHHGQDKGDQLRKGTGKAGERTIGKGRRGKGIKATEIEGFCNRKRLCEREAGKGQEEEEDQPR
ncbi:hypothetical protein NEUTE2DRAFT_63679 [Neurospora tetrasperma FGSC 2509]|nr:hypothetical protein NEUTE2DRAFT_63679 [Neurospora tetrasperma FGSC 2509]